MKRLIDKDDLVVQIEKAIDEPVSSHDPQCPCEDGYYCGLSKAESILDSIEAKEVDTWHLQEKEDIYDAVKDWRLHTFACIMKDSSIQKFNGCCDEDCEGHINVHIDGVNDDYDNVDDIVKWIEYN